MRLRPAAGKAIARSARQAREDQLSAGQQSLPTVERLLQRRRRHRIFENVRPEARKFSCEPRTVLLTKVECAQGTVTVLPAEST